MTRQQRADIEAVRRGLRAGAHSSSKMERQESAARLAALDALLAECEQQNDMREPAHVERQEEKRSCDKEQGR